MCFTSDLASPMKSDEQSQVSQVMFAVHCCSVVQVFRLVLPSRCSVVALGLSTRSDTISRIFKT